MQRKAWLIILFVGVLVRDGAVGKEVFRQMSPTVRVTSYRQTYTDQVVAVSTGSGTVITPAGRILTNHHVVFDLQEQRPYDTFEIGITFDVRKAPVRKYTARLVAHDKALDLALLSLAPANVWDEPIPRLRFMNWNARVSPREGQRVQVFGYPASGGETLTVTQGQISGFDRLNEYTCFKTDTDIDHGSSGGTVLDRRRRFIGIPVFLRSYAENVGYVLDIREARPWIETHLGDPEEVNEAAEQRLRAELGRFVRANDTRRLYTERYPRLSMRIPENWTVHEWGEDGFVAGQERVADPVIVGVYIDRRPFLIDDGFKAKMREEFQRTQKAFPDASLEETIFAGAPAWRVTMTAGTSLRTLIHVFVGNAVLHLAYQIEDHAAEAQQQAVDKALAGFSLIDGAEAPPPDPVRQVALSRPPLRLVLPEGWGARLNPGSEPLERILTAWQEGNHDGVAAIYYRRIDRTTQQMSMSRRLKETMDTALIQDVVHKQDDLILDGLPGYLIVTESAGVSPDEKMRHLSAVISHAEYELVVEYRDRAETFEANADDIRQVLETVVLVDPGRAGRGQTRIGTFGMRFVDIQHHRFAQDIMFLASRDLLKAYPGERFEPENPVSRAQALRLAIDSRNRKEAAKTSGKEIALELPGEAAVPFRDLEEGHWLLPYAHAAERRGLLPFREEDRFDPAGQVTLGEGLVMLFGVYAVPLWKGDSKSEWKLLMDKGYELGLIPRGIDSWAHRLTNAEMAALVRRLYDRMD